MEEIWKMISGYEYEISNFGKVRNVDGELSELLCDKVGEPRKWGTYPRIMILDSECTVHFHSVHRLVAKYFIPNDDPTKIYVDHIDRNRTNSHVHNLRWTTPRENSRNLTKRSDNTSGKQGVSYCKIRELCYWKVHINDNDGKRKAKCFSIKKLGNDEAKRQAIEYRKQLEKLYGYIGD